MELHESLKFPVDNKSLVKVKEWLSAKQMLVYGKLVLNLAVLSSEKTQQSL